MHRSTWSAADLLGLVSRSFFADRSSCCCCGQGDTIHKHGTNPDLLLPRVNAVSVLNLRKLRCPSRSAVLGRNASSTLGAAPTLPRQPATWGNIVCPWSSLREILPHLKSENQTRANTASRPPQAQKLTAVTPSQAGGTMFTTPPRASTALPGITEQNHRTVRVGTQPKVQPLP